MRVLMLTTRFPPDYGGGARHALHLCRKLAKRGVQTSIVTGYKGRSVINEQVDGIPVTRLPLPQQQGLGVFPFYGQLIRALIAQRRNYNLIHAHAIHHHAYAGFLVGRFFSKPAIAKIALLGHDDPASILRRRWGKIQLLMLRQASTLIATSQEIFQAVKAFGWPLQRLAYIPNGVDTSHFHPLSPEARAALRMQLGLPEKCFVVTFVGIIARRKGVHTLARAWPNIKRACPDARLLLIGPCSKDEHWGVDERYVAELGEILVQSGVAESVRFAGKVTDPKPYLQASDLFIFPSRSEGMPNALLEAMACGLPFVATRLGCIEEMAPKEQLPYLVPVDDADALAEAIISLASNAKLRRELGLAVRRTVEERFSLDAVADQYLKLYLQLLEER